MSDFQKQVFDVFKLHLYGLPGFCCLATYELFHYMYIDFELGTISINSLDLLARTDFYVASLCGGAKKEEVTRDKLQNAFRSIKKVKSEHFVFNTVNQRIVITMPFIRELCESMHSKESNKLFTLTSKAMEADHGRTKNL
jgi:hypothetical protein